MTFYWRLSQRWTFFEHSIWGYPFRECCPHVCPNVIFGMLMKSTTILKNESHVRIPFSGYANDNFSPKKLDFHSSFTNTYLDLKHAKSSTALHLYLGFQTTWENIGPNILNVNSHVLYRKINNLPTYILPDRRQYHP